MIVMALVTTEGRVFLGGDPSSAEFAAERAREAARGHAVKAIVWYPHLTYALIHG